MPETINLEDKVKELYVTRQLPLKQILPALHIGQRTLYDYLDKFNIPRRSVHKNYGRVEKVCWSCGAKLVVGENILYPMVSGGDYVCRACRVTRQQRQYRQHRLHYLYYNKRRQGITEASICMVQGCDAPWFILEPHHMPDGIVQLLCPNHHRLWHWQNGKVVRKNRFSDKQYRRWQDVPRNC